MTTLPLREPIGTPLAAFAPSDKAREVFDVIIVGSGYGGSIAAWVLSQCKTNDGNFLRVCLLERGDEFLPGAFPSTFGELPRELRVAHQSSGKVSGHQGLFDLRLGDDVMALVANGLGGGSLINAGVMLAPEPADCADKGFAGLLTTLGSEGWNTRAQQLLGARVKRGGQWVENNASRWNSLPHKTRALQNLAKAGGQAAWLPPITVNLDGQPSFSQAALQACNHCGDCMTGCNQGAKESLDVGLLTAALRGVSPPTIVTRASVTSVLREKGHASWFVRVAHTDPSLQLREGHALRLQAQHVILAAGALGSPEILLRSRSDTLVFSNRLGQGFSCNGDNIGAVRGLPQPVNGCANEDQLPELRGVGPTITASVPLKPDKGKPFQLQEFSVPGPLARLFDETVTTAEALQGITERDRATHDERQSDPLAVNPSAMATSLLVGLIGHDAADGSLVLANPMRPARPAVPQMGALRIVWPQARDGRELHAAHDKVAAFVAGPQGEGATQAPTFVANPMWRLLPPELADLVSQPRGPVLTVHPLGGCGIGDSAATGVVDGCGRVFDAAQDTKGSWQGTLMVLDGSIVPSSLGANPALTISALALRAVTEMAKQWQLKGPDIDGLLAAAPTFDDQPAKGPPEPVPHPPVRRTEVAITERLRGEVSLGIAHGGAPKKAVIELTLAFSPTALQSLGGPLRHEVGVQPAASHIRVWDADEWKEKDLHFADDVRRAKHLKWQAPLSGNLRFLHREPSTGCQRIWRGAHAWLCNRGWRDLYQAWWVPFFTAAGRSRRTAARVARAALPPLTPRNSSRFGKYLAVASHAGEVRRFDYTLHIGAIDLQAPDWAPPPGPRELLGHKRLTYNRRASPWRQLTELTLTQLPGLTGSAPVLKLDPRFLAAQVSPLLSVAHQRNQAEALAELLSLALYLMRVLASVHLWTFRKPDPTPPRVVQRLPGPIAGLPAPNITELVVDRWPAASATPGAPLSIRLTHYARANSGKPALVMIHGYSVSGNTFTHPALQERSAAAWFWNQGRDIWVVDLRTSSGLASATYPWAMEQPALVDIPAALLHIRQASGGPVDVLAHCIGCAMLSMAILSDAKDVRDGNIELGVDSWLTSEHFGTLTAFNGARPDGGQHATLNKVVLSQKGPLLRYTDANVLRAHVMQYMRRWLLNDSYQFTPSADPGVAEQLLDRLLASLPYPDADYDIENPLRPCATTPWTATRHRMDALYGRDFSADNMTDAVLRSIDDLFGPINLDTVSQTIHFARYSAITNQRGRGEFVTEGRLRSRWGKLPTLAIHGSDNGLIDVGTERLLQDQFKAAGLPLEVKTHCGMGHQDVLIGKRVEEVFSNIKEFLDRQHCDTTKVPPAPKQFVAVSPWVGPRVLSPSATGALAQLGAMSRLDQGEGTFVLAPAWRRQSSAGVVSFTLLAHPTAWVWGERGGSGRWLKARPATPDLEALMRLLPSTPDGEWGWLAVVAHERAEVTAMAIHHALTSGEPDVPAATQAWLQRETVPTLERSFVRLADLKRAEGTAQQGAWNRPLRFAVASCQYPHGLFDPQPAGASLAALADGRTDVDLALMLGDQIYADATAGLLDPTRSDELYALPHERALRTPGMAAVMRRMPSWMLLDDHELEDNWEPLPPGASGPAAQREVQRLNKAREQGMAAYFRFQRPGAKSTGRQVPRHADLPFEAGGHAFYLLDTRSARQRGRPSQSSGPSALIDDGQFQQLEQWLLEHRQQVKFVCTPSLLLPRRVLSAAHAENATYSDAWCGYPQGLWRLLRFVADHSIDKLVFLSGDEHHSMHATAQLQSALGTGRLVSVHSSALYAPFPFANGRQRDLVKSDKGTLHGVAFDIQTEFAPGGDGFAVLEVKDPAISPTLQLRWHRPGQADQSTHPLPL